MISPSNLEVAKVIAIAYGLEGDLQTVMNNLKYIKILLENPEKDNPHFTWDD